MREGELARDAVDAAALAFRRRARLLGLDDQIVAAGAIPRGNEAIKRQFLERFDRARRFGDALPKFEVSHRYRSQLAAVLAEAVAGRLTADHHVLLVRRILAEAWVEHERMQASEAKATRRHAEAMRALHAFADDVACGAGGTLPTVDDVSPMSLASVLDHGDGGERIRQFLREPDDGGPPIPHEPGQHWELDSEQAGRVIRRFRSPTRSRPLTEREHQVVVLYASGDTARAIADQLHLGIETVRTYLRRARQKGAALGYDSSTREDLRALLRAIDAPH